MDWESNRNHLSFGKLSCRNPFKVDERLVNYNLDSEDEWAEENAEDLDDEDKKGSDSEDESGDEPSQDSFIVDDGYLSLTEMIDSDLEQDETSQQKLIERRKALIQRNRERLAMKDAHMQDLASGPQIQLFTDQDTTDTFKVISLMGSFPLQVKREKVAENENEE